MTIIRDFLRRRRVSRHVAAYGYTFYFHGLKVRISEDSPPGVGSALIRQKYEREEAYLIIRHLPAERAVIELGGSIGVVSALIRSRLAADVKHIVVEANPALIDFCRQNAAQGTETWTEVVNAALGYGAPVLRFAIGNNIHANHLAGANEGAARIIEVPAITLEQLVTRSGIEDGFSLVCDIEGAELDLVQNELAVLGRAGMVIMELHPGVYPGGSRDEAELHYLMQKIGFALLERVGDVCLWCKGASRTLKD